MQTETLPPIRISKKLMEQLDRMVREGYYGSKSEAVRYALRCLGGSQLGILKPFFPPGASSVKLVREIREEMWKEYLETAGGDKEKAIDLFFKGSTKAPRGKRTQ